MLYEVITEADITGITMPITKHNYLVQDPLEIPRIVKEAFHIASTGRPGPVLIDLPKDVQNRITSYNVCYTKLLRYNFHLSPQ